MATITSLGFSIFSRYDGSGVRRAQKDIDDFEKRMNKSAKGFSNWATSFGGMASAAVALGPALLPVATAATGAVAAFGALATVGGAAMGIFGLAAFGAVKNTMALSQSITDAHTALLKQQTALDKLTPGTKAYATQLGKVNQAQALYNKQLAAVSAPQRAFITSMNGLTTAWTGFISKTQNSTLGPVATILQAGAVALGKIQPLVVQTAPFAQEIATSIKNWTANGGLDRFLQLVQKYGIPALSLLSAAARNVLGFLGDGFRAALPSVQPLTVALEHGSTALQNWSANGGFTRFFDKVKQDGPKVGDLLTTAWQAVQNLGTAAAGAAGGALSLSTEILKLIANTPPDTIRAIATAFLAWKSPLLAMFLFVPGLASAFQTLMSHLRPGDIYAIGAAFIALRAALFVLDLQIAETYVLIAPMIAIAAVLGLAIYEIATRTTWFQTAWQYTWNAVKAAAIFVWNFLKTAFREFIGQMKELWHELQDAFFGTWHAIDTGVYQPMVTAWHQLNNGFRDFIGALEAAWRGLETAFFATWHWIDTNIYGNMKKGINDVKSGFDTAMSGIKTAWHGLQDATAAPVRFFVNTVYDSGLKAAWNATVGHILPSLKLPDWRVKFATGGHVRGPGGPTEDRVPIMASAGEYVIRAAAAKRIGYRMLDRLNRYATGGPVLGGSKTAPLGGDSFSGQGGPGYNPGLFGSINPVDWVIDMGRDVAAAGVRALLAPVRGLVNTIGSRFPGGVGQYVTGVANGSFDKLIALVKGQVKDPAYTASAGVAQWKGVVLQALSMLGQSPSNLGNVLKAINKESGGNPNIWNTTDINAQHGTPSGGLLQVIQPTFDAYAGPFLGHSLLGPLANVYAAINYAIHRYGAGWSARMAEPGGYAAGGMIPFGSYDSGGYLPKGFSVAFNGTGKPEPVGAAATGAAITFRDCTFVGGTQKDFEDVLVAAWSEAKRKGRIK
jgi:hypothetical protein